MRAGRLIATVAMAALFQVSAFGQAPAGVGTTAPTSPTAPLGAATAPVQVVSTTVAAPPAAAPPAAVPAAPATPAAATPAPPSGDAYVLGVNDRLRVIVFGEESLSGEFLVDSTGRVAMPFIGEVPATGLSRRQFEEALQKRMREEQILLDPRVSVEVINTRPFYILGEVTRPGEYPSTTNLNVFNAVATAGGFTSLANQTRVMIKRAGETTEREYSLLSPVSVNPGDTIRVIKGAFYILGEVTRPGEYPFSEGLTIQNAVATAGGFTYRANQRQVYVKRRDQPNEEKVKVTASTPVQPGDTIRVTERFF